MKECAEVNKRANSKGFKGMVVKESDEDGTKIGE